MDKPTGDARIRFGAFELDVRARELRNAGARVRVQEQPFEILRLLVERPGAVVTRDEMRQRLWPDGTFVDFEHSLNAAVKRLRALLGDDADNPRFIETLPRRGYRFVAEVADAAREHGREAGRAQTRATRVAVLPFANLTNDPAQQYFSDGLTEEMIAQLGRLCGPRIGVLARWSSMAVRDIAASIRDVGGVLDVGYVLEGSVRRDLNRVRITARLVETAGETQLWADTYERDLTDCLAVQADVAARIARSLATELLPAAPPALRPPVPEAYQAYLKGRFHWNKPGDDGLREAVQYFDQAIAIDPEFAVAHASRARALIAQASYYDGLPKASLEAARVAVHRALALDPTHWRSYVALGDVRRLLEWDWNGAESAYAQAIALNPSSESAHRAYGLLLVVLGRTAHAIEEADRALELDPLCLVVGTSAALVRYMAGDYEAVIDRCRASIELDEQYGFSLARRLLGAAYLQAGRPVDAVAELERALAQAGPQPVLLSWLIHARAVTGNLAGAQTLMDHLRAAQVTGPVASYHLALACVGLGDHTAAFAALDNACRDREPVLASVAVEPRFAPLRADPRYRHLLTRLGLPLPRRGADTPRDA